MPESNLTDNLAPRILWNMLLLCDCIHLKDTQKQGWGPEGYNLHRLRATLKSIMNAFQIIVDRILAPRNKDIHLASIALSQGFDEDPQRDNRPPPWANFPLRIKPWLLPDSWEAMRRDLDTWGTPDDRRVQQKNGAPRPRSHP